MNASNGFRSHLMQQFVAAARNQTRPPVALVGVSSAATTSGSEQQDNSNNNHTTTRGSRHSSSSLSSLPSQQSLRYYHYFRREESSASAAISNSLSSSSPRFLSGTTVEEESSASSSAQGGQVSNEDEQHPPPQELSVALQNLIQTRRTSSRFLLSSTTTQTPEYWKAALDRAVACGLAAPNHKRTEPFFFRRMIAPSEATERLAEIVYQVRLRQQKGNKDDDQSQQAARKREKWNQIPAFLVALVQGTTTLSDSDQQQQQEPQPNNDLYVPLPYVAPNGERELEDYAAACAAVQNVLLSLHSEQIASKWATGPVVRTQAFRDLVQAQPGDRVVALVMLGEEGRGGRKQHNKPRRHHQTWEVALVDL